MVAIGQAVVYEFPPHAPPMVHGRRKRVKAHVETSERGLKLKSHQGRGKGFTEARNGALKQEF